MSLDIESNTNEIRRKSLWLDEDNRHPVRNDDVPPNRRKSCRGRYVALPPPPDAGVGRRVRPVRGGLPPWVGRRVDGDRRHESVDHATHQIVRGRHVHIRPALPVDVGQRRQRAEERVRGRGGEHCAG